MTRLFLAAGVAALAIAAPASAGPGGEKGGHGGGQPAAAPHGGGGGGGGHGQVVGGGGHGGGGGGGGHGQVFGGGGHGGGGGFVAFQGHGGGGGGHGQAFMRPFGGHGGGGGGGHGQPFARAYGGHGGGGHGFAAFQGPHGGRAFGGHGGGHAQRFAQARGGHGQAVAHQQFRGGGHAGRQAFAHQQVRGGHGQQQAFDRGQLHGGHGQQQVFARQQALAHGQFGNGHAQGQAFANQQLNGGQLFTGGGKFGGNPKDFVRNQQLAYQQALTGTSFAPLYYGTSAQILAPTVVEQFVGVPVQTVSNFVTLAPMPASFSYLYPATPDYYYEYGDGYAYEIDRNTSLVAALLPLLAGGYLPGQFLPQPYMASYVPDYYGLNDFYPDYGDTCNRYANGVVYEVDCYTGMVEDVIPLYAGGYGVGQLLPSAYDYYNVPMQYRPLYYDTADYGYWYAPGAIYQYDQRSSMITSVAALLSPGFTIGQPLPVGYDVYNVPYAYRTAYYDTPTAWYRYNNGYIYQVDPVTQLVTAIVASVLT